MIQAIRWYWQPFWAAVTPALEWAEKNNWSKDQLAQNTSASLQRQLSRVPDSFNWRNLHTESVVSVAQRLSPNAFIWETSAIARELSHVSPYPKLLCRTLLTHLSSEDPWSLFKALEVLVG